MKNRQTPCTECRQHRRKCIRSASNNKCSRCERLDRNCMQPPEDFGTYLLDWFQKQKLQSELTHLEWAMEEMKNQLQTLSCRKSPTNRNNNYARNSIQNLAQNWAIEIKNGSFHIETGIKTLRDLLVLQSNDLNYLSPFSGYSSDSSNEGELNLNFGSINFESLIPFTMKLVTYIPKENAECNVVSYPNNLFYKSRTVIDQLVSTFFGCHNVYTSMLHKNSFLKRYRQLENPASDLLSLSICSYVCAAPCGHVYYSPWERRKMADYYFIKARAIILEHFDVPEKRLENMISINFLSKYLQMTLRYQECRALITIGYQICLDLRPSYRMLFDEEDSSCLIQYYSEDSLDKILYSRHFILTMSVRRLTNHIFGSVQDSHLHLPQWRIMEDELDISKRIIRAQNWFLILFNHPYIEHFMNLTRKMYGGEVCTLNIESIMHMEDVILEWSKSMPEEFILCDNLKDYDLCKAVLSKTNDIVSLMVFLHCQTFLLTIYSRLLQPVAQNESSDGLLSCVQQRSLDSCLTACRLLIYAIRQLSEVDAQYSCYYKLTACEFLYNVIDALMILSTSPSQFIAKESRESVHMCLREIDRLNVTIGFFDTSSHSFVSDFSDKSKFNFKYYDQYPQPWCAMMYDVSQYIMSLT